MDSDDKSSQSLNQLLADVCFVTSFWMVTGQDGTTLRISLTTSIFCCGVKPTTLVIRLTNENDCEQVNMVDNKTITSSILFYLIMSQCSFPVLGTHIKYWRLIDARKNLSSVSCSISIAWRDCIMFANLFFALELFGWMLMNLRLVFIVSLRA